MDGKILGFFWNTNELLAGRIKVGKHEEPRGCLQEEMPIVHVPQTLQAQAFSRLVNFH